RSGGGRGGRPLIGARRHDPILLRATTKLVCRDHGHVGVNALAHLGAAMVHLDRAILINQHQCPSLVEMRDSETYAEFDRRDGQAPFHMQMLPIPRGYFLAAPREIARSLQLAPDGLDTVV